MVGKQGRVPQECGRPFYSGATGRFLARSDLTEFSPFKLLKVKVDLKFR